MKNKNGEVEGVHHNLDIKLYARRWLLLALFMWYACNAGMHWMQFSCISNVVTRYYNVSSTLVEWTSIMNMAGRTFLLFPSLFIMDKMETRNTLILATSLCLIGAVIKGLSVSPDRFYILMAGQVFIALSLVFTYGLVGRFSSAWFSSKEISKAGALACVGDQMGSVVGFLVPTILVPDSPNVEEIEKGMRTMHIAYSSAALVTLIMILIFFKSKPKRPPSAAQVHNRLNKTQRVYKSVAKILTNPNFLMFSFSHSFAIGTACNAFGTLLNEMIITNFPGSSKDIGRIGALTYVGGIVGSVVLGSILDKTRKFKGNAVTLALAASFSLALCTVALKMDSIVYVYISNISLGFFIQAYYATGIQMGIELTFPVQEGITVATMSVFIELCSMIVTAVFGLCVKKYGDLSSNICITILLFLSSFITCLVPAKFKREELEQTAKSTEMKEFLSGQGKKPVVVRA